MIQQFQHNNNNSDLKRESILTLPVSKLYNFNSHKLTKNKKNIHQIATLPRQNSIPIVVHLSKAFSIPLCCPKSNKILADCNQFSENTFGQFPTLLSCESRQKKRKRKSHLIDVHY